MTGLSDAIVALAVVVLVTGLVFFVVKWVRFRWTRARDLRRAIYINTISELVARLAIPDVELEGWRKDPIFAERLVNALDIFDGVQRAHLVKLAGHVGLTEDLIRDLGGRTVGKRLDAATALARLSSPDLLEPLTEALGDAAAEVRVQAAVALSRIGAAESVPKIIRRMNMEEDWAARLMADALTEFGSVAVPAMAADILIDQPLIEGHGRYVPDLVRALGAIGDPTAEPALMHALESDNPIVRLRAAQALGRAGTPKSVSALLVALGDDDWRVRSKGAEALGLQGDVRAAGPLRAAMRDSEWWVRQSAAEALGKIPGGDELLISAIDDEDRFARDAAIERLTLTGAVRRARDAGPGDALHDKLTELGRIHLVESP